MIYNAVDGYVNLLPFMCGLYSLEYIGRRFIGYDSPTFPMLFTKVIFWPAYIPFWYYAMYRIHVRGDEKMVLNLEFTAQEISIKQRN